MSRSDTRLDPQPASRPEEQRLSPRTQGPDPSPKLPALPLRSHPTRYPGVAWRPRVAPKAGIILCFLPTMEASLPHCRPFLPGRNSPPPVPTKGQPAPGNPAQAPPLDLTVHAPAPATRGLHAASPLPALLPPDPRLRLHSHQPTCDPPHEPSPGVTSPPHPSRPGRRPERPPPPHPHPGPRPPGPCRAPAPPTWPLPAVQPDLLTLQVQGSGWAPPPLSPGHSPACGYAISKVAGPFAGAATTKCHE